MNGAKFHCTLSFKQFNDKVRKKYKKNVEVLNMASRVEKQWIYIHSYIPAFENMNTVVSTYPTPAYIR